MLVELFKEQRTRGKARGYIGCSVIGNPCDRFLWIEKEGLQEYELDNRMARVFERGSLEEPRLLDLIENCTGVELLEMQAGLDYSLLKGHVDAVVRIDGKTYILEFKTMNERSWKAFKKQGCLAAKPQYFAQVQTYMGLAGIGRAILLAVNKNTEEICEEVIEFSHDYYLTMLERAERIAAMQGIPLGLWREDAKELPPNCNYCSYMKFCWGKEMEVKRTKLSRMFEG